MAYVQGSLGEKISKTMDDAAALFKQGVYQQSIDTFARAWDLLPDSKYPYDESYLKMCIRDRDAARLRAAEVRAQADRFRGAMAAAGSEMCIRDSSPR